MTNSDIVPFEMLLAWPLLIYILVRIDRRHGDAPLFIAYAYIAGLAVNHWFGGLVHSFPWKPFANSTTTIDGFAATTLGLAFFVLGAALVPKLHSAPRIRRSATAVHTLQSVDRSGHRVGTILLTVGVASWLANMTFIGGLPSMAAILSGGKQLLLGGICLKSWLAWQDNDTRSVFRWLALGFAFPAYTILVEGFLGFGMTFLMTILIFVSTFYRPRWHIGVGGLVALFAAMSLYVSYVENRANIRSQVWGGATMENRVDSVMKMIGEIGPFDVGNPAHLSHVDARLNQNWLVGAAIGYVPALRDYAHGETLFMAVIALVPRAIWPDKPVVGGSMGLVEAYTGINFAWGTSVGIGQVLEFYINFGYVGIAVGFLIFGIILRYIDLRLCLCLQNEVWNEVALWFAVGSSMLQPIGQLVEISASMGAAAVVGVLVGHYATRKSDAARPVRTPINRRRF